MLRHLTIMLALIASLCHTAAAQEVNAKVVVNHKQVQGTNTSVFDNLQEQLTEFINNRQWTHLQFSPKERIACTFNITVSKYDASNDAFTATLLVQAARPVYNSNYNTTEFAFQDNNFGFNFKEFDNLLFREDQIDNNLTALVAFYVYLIIGIDLDTMSPLGGTAPLQTAQSIVNAAQNIDAKGWKAFESSNNRYAIINDYLDGSMQPYRNMQYKYHREGLDEMATNSERGRAAIYAAVKLLDEAKQNKPLGMLPQIFTEYKGEELANIFAGKGTAKEREDVYNILSAINPSLNNIWNRIK